MKEVLLTLAEQGEIRGADTGGSQDPAGFYCTCLIPPIKRISPSEIE